MIALTPLATDGLKAFDALHDRPCFGGCYCAVWTSFGPDWGARCRSRKPNREATHARVRAGGHVGFLVSEGDATVGWVGAGPRSGFPHLDHRAAVRLVAGAPTDWFVGCFAIPPEHRGRGLADAILEAVCERAARAGARWVDATPVTPFDEPRAYRGTDRLYARHGFEEVQWEADGNHRVVLMRRAV